MRRVTVFLCLAMVAGLAACRQAPASPQGEVFARLLVGLADATRRVERTVDAARYRAERGPAMRAAVALGGEGLDDLRAAAGELAQAIDPSDQSAPAGLLRQTVMVALDAADETEQELAALQPLLAADELMDRAVASWRATPDTALAVEVAALATSLAAAPALPSSCRTLWDNRSRWTTLVAVRTPVFAGPPTSAGRREGFLAEPFGEDRRAADTVDRACWREHGALPTAVREIRALVRQYEAAIGKAQ